MSLEHLLLAMLEKPSTGYALKREIDGGVRYFWSAELAQIYPTLQSLEKRGWLRSEKEPSAQGPPRRVYTRTAAGTRHLHRWLQAEPIMGTERFAYIGQLIYLYQLKDLRVTLRFMQQLRAKQAANLEVLEAAQRAILPSPSGLLQDMSDEGFHGWLSLGLGIHAISARVSWCDEVIPKIRQRIRDQAKKSQRAKGGP